MLNTRDMGAVLTAKLDSLLGLIDPLVANGQVVWENIGDKFTAFEAWSAANTIDHCQWNCDSDIITGVTQQSSGRNTVIAIDGALEVRCSTGPLPMRVLDALGRQLWSGTASDGLRIPTHPWPVGTVIAELLGPEAQERFVLLVR
jgi:hypothetical protein